MRKIFVILIFLTLTVYLPAFAEDDSMSTGGVEDLMKSTGGVENAFAGQKPITDEEFQKTLDQVKGKKKRKRDKNIPKGKYFNEESSGEHIDETSQKNILLGVPLCLKNGDGTEIPTGHYKIVGEKKDGKVYLNFYQSSTLVAKVPAIETNGDFGKMDINFVELQPYNEERVRVIYGSMDFNAYTFIKIEKPISFFNP
ncbi:MAG: hypothetical protein PHC64_02090 [Candidatus Gastranaerophilales bacterium]|nr:hypothetical protein [Candidatus Gastranaerophilales bacterium]